MGMSINYVKILVRSFVTSTLIFSSKCDGLDFRFSVVETYEKTAELSHSSPRRLAGEKSRILYILGYNHKTTI